MYVVWYAGRVCMRLGFAWGGGVHGVSAHGSGMCVEVDIRVGCVMDTCGVRARGTRVGNVAQRDVRAHGYGWSVGCVAIHTCVECVLRWGCGDFRAGCSGD